jgi:hypothetical protein
MHAGIGMVYMMRASRIESDELKSPGFYDVSRDQTRGSFFHFLLGLVLLCHHGATLAAASSLVNPSHIVCFW